MEDHLLPIYLRPSILFPVFVWGIWMVVIWWGVARYTPTKHPGIVRFVLLSPLVWFYLFFWLGVPPILIGVFPHTDAIANWYDRTIWAFILIGYYFGIGPGFVTQAEARHRNKFGFFKPSGATTGNWQVDPAAPRVHFVGDAKEDLASGAGSPQTH